MFSSKYIPSHKPPNFLLIPFLHIFVFDSCNVLQRTQSHGWQWFGENIEKLIVDFVSIHTSNQGSLKAFLCNRTEAGSRGGWQISQTQSAAQIFLVSTDIRRVWIHVVWSETHSALKH